MSDLFGHERRRGTLSTAGAHAWTVLVCLLVLAGGCSQNATVRLKDGTTVRGPILSPPQDDPGGIYVGTGELHAEVVRLRRGDVRSIERLGSNALVTTHDGVEIYGELKVSDADQVELVRMAPDFVRVERADVHSLSLPGGGALVAGTVLLALGVATAAAATMAATSGGSGPGGELAAAGWVLGGIVGGVGVVCIVVGATAGSGSALAPPGAADPYRSPAAVWTSHDSGGVLATFGWRF